MLDTSISPRIIDLFPNDSQKPIVSAFLFSKEHSHVAKMFWQHTGEGISSRRAEYCSKAFYEGRLSATRTLNRQNATKVGSTILCKGPRRYQKHNSMDTTLSCEAIDQPGEVPNQPRDHAQFVEERFGRNLDKSLSDSAKLAIRRRIAGALTANVDLSEALRLSHPPTRTASVDGFSEDDVYLYSCGMNAIFHAHNMMMACKGNLKSVSYGFPYTDTLKILEKFGPGCQFYGYGSDEELDDLEKRCEAGERFLAVFCEFPGNPLLQTPNLPRIRSLANHYGFAVVVDETIGNFFNVHVLPYADIVVSSLTKVFTGECNVMGGSMVLNPRQQYYSRLKRILNLSYEDNYWPEDAIFMERNSRDFVTRIKRINENAEAICDALIASPHGTVASSHRMRNWADD
ncbi:uncharacterized protein KY384_005891 [Bacidia gigantensis]|uniref:uncharacterized protein n=1 Tax=Bacidia gigantensis TaxID=2732470 RepID=UPI001D04BA14|nr:uncharacterized protein KY384_005891 [Bacidia gigantensis]KAG8529256.1 hypothetical protein KY384_005891 [Bacidia gigantensis]